MTKRFLALVCALLLIGSFALADGSIPGSRICLVCGSPTDESECPVCGALRECWVCYDCLTKNLSDTCMVCRTEKQDSLACQAEDPHPLSAWPAVSHLAAEGDPENLLRLGRYYAPEDGVNFFKLHGCTILAEVFANHHIVGTIDLRGL